MTRPPTAAADALAAAASARTTWGARARWRPSGSPTTQSMPSARGRRGSGRSRPTRCGCTAPATAARPRRAPSWSTCGARPGDRARRAATGADQGRRAGRRGPMPAGLRGTRTCSPGCPVGRGRPGAGLGPQSADRLGELLGRLHAFAEGYTPPPGFRLPVWDGDGLCTERSPFRPGPLEALLPAEWALLTASRNATGRVLDRLGHGRAVFGVIDADYILGNCRSGGARRGCWTSTTAAARLELNQATTYCSRRDRAGYLKRLLRAVRVRGQRPAADCGFRELQARDCRRCPRHRGDARADALSPYAARQPRHRRGAAERRPGGIVECHLRCAEPLGIEITELPLRPNKIWHMIQNARTSAAAE